MSDEQPERDPFVPIGFAAHAVGRPSRTIRTWARDGTVRRRDTGRVEVHVGDAARAAQTKGRRPGRLPGGGESA